MHMLSERVIAAMRAACPDTVVLDRLVSAVQPLLAEAVRSQSTLLTTKTTLEALIRHFPGGLVSVFDRELRHVLVGGETATQLGHDPARMIGKTPSEYRAGDQADSLEGLIYRTLMGESVRGLEYDGGRSTLVISTPIHDHDGVVVGAIVVGQDVTDLVVLQEEKFEQERARAVLEQELATIRARAAIIDQVLHEVRNPLASLASSAEMLERYDDRMSPDKRADHLRRISHEVRMLALAMAKLAQIHD
jgi:PAS domain S-box-containing protein